MTKKQNSKMSPTPTRVGPGSGSMALIVPQLARVGVYWPVTSKSPHECGPSLWDCEPGGFLRPVGCAVQR